MTIAAGTGADLRLANLSALRVVIAHLLTNAACHARVGSQTVHVTVSARALGDDAAASSEAGGHRYCEVSLADDGPGIVPDILKRIGEPYLSRRRNVGDAQSGRTGLGLGIFIARTLLERTGARVSFKNRTFPDHGAVVRIVWPRIRFETAKTIVETTG